jgi:hypothetical protein
VGIQFVNSSGLQGCSRNVPELFWIAPMPYQFALNPLSLGGTVSDFEGPCQWVFAVTVLHGIAPVFEHHVTQCDMGKKRHVHIFMTESRQHTSKATVNDNLGRDRVRRTDTPNLDVLQYGVYGFQGQHMMTLQ